MSYKSETYVFISFSKDIKEEDIKTIYSIVLNNYVLNKGVIPLNSFFYYDKENYKEYIKSLILKADEVWFFSLNRDVNESNEELEVAKNSDIAIRKFLLSFDELTKELPLQNEITLKSYVLSRLKAKGKSQTDFAKDIGTMQAHISNILAGKQRLSVNIAEKMADYFNIDAYFLLEIAEKAYKEYKEKEKIGD